MHSEGTGLVGRVVKKVFLLMGGNKDVLAIMPPFAPPGSRQLFLLMCGNKDVLARMPPFAPPSGRGLTKGTCEVFGGKPNGHMRMLTGASRRLAKRHSVTVRSPLTHTLLSDT